MAKIPVTVIYGGRSAEHEVSCRSAAFVLRNLDPNKYDIAAIAINKDGHWLPQDATKLLAATEKTVPILEYKKVEESKALALTSASSGGSPRVIFPVLHGTFGEDGTMQGMFDLFEVAYVGPDTLGSAVGMDKAVSKKLAQAHGVPVVPYMETKLQFWKKNANDICQAAIKELGLPLFVKPARLGSSVGISKVKTAADLQRACNEAFKFDEKILFEKGLNVREIECAVLGDYDPDVSIPGEVVVTNAEFYDYDAKYINEHGADVVIPAKLDPVQVKTAQQLSKLVFQALDLYGMARVDLFLEKGTGKFYFNEVNTIPGFTSISQFPMLWKASGVSAGELIDRLIDLAIKRHTIRKNIQRSK
jgi:D-alanine-D-alanine ligase